MPTPSQQLAELTRQLEAAHQENARLKAKASTVQRISMKVSEKGAVSVYGLGRFPVTLYREQWERLLGMSADVLAFIEVNKAHLPTKAEKAAAEAQASAPKGA